MDSADNGSTAKEINHIFGLNKNLTNSSGRKLVFINTENPKSIMCQISKLIKTNKICSLKNKDQKIEIPISIRNQELTKRNIDKGKTENYKNNKNFNLNNCNAFNFQTINNIDMPDNEHNTKIENFETNSQKKFNMLNFEGFNHQARSIIMKSLININKNKNNSINHILNQGKIHTSEFSNKILYNKISFKVSKIKGNIFKNFLLRPKLSSPLKPMMNDISSNLKKSKFHRTISLRPETSIKNPSANQHQGDRPFSRYNKESIFSKINSDSDIKSYAAFPIKNMNLHCGSENIELLPSSWQK